MKYASYSDCGGRKYNEDSVKVIFSEEYICAILADGLGGHGGGAIASQMAVNTIANEVMLAEGKAVTKETVEKWCQKANRQVMSKQTDICKMKTTMVMLFYKKGEGKAIVAHVGDSRAYQFTNGSYLFCTFDHSVSRMAVVSGEIPIEAVRHHVDRNKLLRSMGGNEEVKIEIDELTIESHELNDFLLCSDGFWEYVTEDVMERTLQQAKEPEKWLSEMRRHVCLEAPKESDNHSAIAIQIREE